MRSFGHVKNLPKGILSAVPSSSPTRDSFDRDGGGFPQAVLTDSEQGHKLLLETSTPYHPDILGRNVVYKSYFKQH